MSTTTASIAVYPKGSAKKILGKRKKTETKKFSDFYRDYLNESTIDAQAWIVVGDTKDNLDGIESAMKKDENINYVRSDSMTIMVAAQPDTEAIERKRERVQQLIDSLEQ